MVLTLVMCCEHQGMEGGLAALHLCQYPNV